MFQPAVNSEHAPIHYIQVASYALRTSKCAPCSESVPVFWHAHGHSKKNLAIISGVTKEEMADDEFMVLEINGLYHNSQMSDCDDRPGYHIVYLSELLYAVSIDLKENISSNPGCEWQLKYFGK
jgi:hypothetical protein